MRAPAFVAFITVLICACETAEERGARENAELDLKVKEREADQDRKRAKVTAAAQEMDAATQKLKKMRAEQEQRETLARFSGLTAAGRVEALRKACADGCNGVTVQAIVDAAPESEREKLRGMVPTLERAAAVTKRERFADNFDDLLLAKHLNPDGVSATGTDKTTMHVRGWFCTRQFVFDITNGDLGKSAAAAGFKILQCEGAAETFTGQL